MVDAIQSPPAAPAPDLDAIQQQIQPAALKGLDDAGLVALLRDLRGMKAGAGDVAMQKALAQAIRSVVAEKRQREGDAGAALAPANRLDKAAAKAGKAEEKARKEAERAERKRVKEAERAEKKAAKAARKDEAGKLADARDKAREKKLAKLGKVKAEKSKPAKDKPAKAGPAKDKPAKAKSGDGKPGQNRTGQGQNRADKGKAAAKADPAAAGAVAPSVPGQAGRDSSGPGALAGASLGDEDQS